MNAHRSVAWIPALASLVVLVPACSNGPGLDCVGPERDAMGACMYVAPRAAGQIGGACTPSVPSCEPSAECVRFGFGDIDAGMCMGECDPATLSGCMPGFECVVLVSPTGPDTGACYPRCDASHPCGEGLLCDEGQGLCQAPECDGAHGCGASSASCNGGFCEL